MPQQTVPVFVSSTRLDLMPEREAVRDAVLRMRQTQFVGMEYFGSRDETTRQASLDDVDRSLVYVGVIAARYGSGITEAEYERAREKGLPCFVYFKSDETIPDESRETDPEQTAKLDAFKQKLRENHIIGPDFINPQDLAAKLTADLHRWLTDEYLASASVSLIPTLHQLRAPVGDFVGREKEIDELLATLRGGGNAAIAGISGMGGIGKSELAFYVANELRDTYPDAQLVLDMRGTDDRPRDTADALASCIRAFLGLEQRLPDDLEELKRLYLSVLEGKRALILLDNALDGAQVRPLLPPAGSALLVTSRNAITLPGMKTRVTLDQLKPGEAGELLTGLSPRVSPDVADEICRLCGYLPLAIRAAGSLLDVTIDLDPEEYAAQLGDERTRLELIGAEGVDVSVEASFNLSYARLTPDAARVFRTLSVFPGSFNGEAEQNVCDDENHRHLTDLLRRSLVLFNFDTRRYRLHDLARFFADSRLSDEERYTGRLAHAAQYFEVLRECDELYLQGGEAFKNGLALFDAERRNIEAGQKWVCEHTGVDEMGTLLCNAYPLAGVYVLSLRRHPREAIAWHEAGLAAARQLKNRIDEVAHIGNLGTAYDELGETHRAIEFYEQNLEVGLQSGDRHVLGSALGSLGAAYLRLGETRRAIEFLGKRLTIARIIGDRRGEEASLGNLGLAYADLGEFGRAAMFHAQHVILARESGDRRGEGQGLGNLGLAYFQSGDTIRAIEFYEQNLVIAREIGDRWGEGAMLGNLGNAYVALGEARRALEFYGQQLLIAGEIGDRRGEGNALYNTSLALDQLGSRTNAITLAEAALEIYEEVDSPMAASARTRLAQWREEATKGE
jgi:tetratricopeptide (TPR) repeat protein